MVWLRWLVLVLGGAVWAGSWYVMYREIYRWHHVKPSLAFNYDIAPDAHPGLPLILVYIACVVGPLLFLAGIFLLVATHRG
jgi:hypothetical protein